MHITARTHALASACQTPHEVAWKRPTSTYQACRDERTCLQRGKRAGTGRMAGRQKPLPLLPNRMGKVEQRTRRWGAGDRGCRSCQIGCPHARFPLARERGGRSWKGTSSFGSKPFVRERPHEGREGLTVSRSSPPAQRRRWQRRSPRRPREDVRRTREPDARALSRRGSRARSWRRRFRRSGSQRARFFVQSFVAAGQVLSRWEVCLMWVWLSSRSSSPLGRRLQGLGDLPMNVESQDQK